MNLIDAIAQVAGLAWPQETAASRTRSLAAAPTAAAKPVLQICSLPITLNPDDYRNPRSGTNPNGDLRSLFALRQLVDPVPNFSHYYSPSASSTEDAYGQILRGAAMLGSGQFAATVLAGARQRFAEQVFPNLDGNPGSWRPIYAVPEDWYDTSDPERYQSIEIDLRGDEGPTSPFVQIDDQAASRAGLQLVTGQGPAGVKPLDQGTRLQSMRMKYLLVQFRRPWLDALLFESGGWFLSRQPQGFCSSGNIADNPGVLPLLPMGMLVATEVELDARWGAADQGRIDAARASGDAVCVGPLALQAADKAKTLQVVGWLSSVVPYSPQDTDLQPGCVLIRNTGAFVMRFSVSWQLGGRTTTQTSGSFPALAARSINIPAEARNLAVAIEIMTFPPPAETWATLATHQFPAAVTRCYQASGTTISPELQEVACTAS